MDFEDVNGILPLRYLNSNISYNLIFRGRNWKNMASELDTDRYNTSGGHNIRETKAIITAFARHKLTDDFPDNLDTLDLPLDYSYFKKRETRLSGGVITNGKKEIPIRHLICSLILLDGLMNTTIELVLDIEYCLKRV